MMRCGNRYRRKKIWAGCVLISERHVRYSEEENTLRRTANHFSFEERYMFGATACVGGRKSVLR